MRLTPRHLLLLAALPFAALLVAGTGAPAHSTSNLTVLNKERNSFENWDFESEQVSSRNVDWMFTLLFYNSSQRKVNDTFDSDYPNGGNPEYARMYETYYNNNQWFWDANSGRKNSVSGCFGTDAAHYRVYARPDTGHNYNTAWGFWTAATTHRDHMECFPWATWYGFSDDAENNVAASARRILGPRRVLGNSHNWHNPEYCPTKTNPHSTHGACVKQGNAYMQSDGYATAIYLP